MQANCKKVAILQSNYIPWKGYFDLIHDVDLFIFYDDVQYTHSDWRHRNKLMTRDGPRWLTIPAGHDLKRLICEVEIPDQGWKQQHRSIIEQNYRNAPFIEESQSLLDFLYANPVTNLSDYNQRAIRHFSNILGIRAEFTDSRLLGVNGRKTERLIGILESVGATKYISGPSARDYIDEPMFAEAGIELAYKEYPAYPDYHQCFTPFSPFVSVLDLLFNVGLDAAPYYIWGWRDRDSREL
ncbi:MAG: WbqC family protein [Nitrosospira sp.]